MKIIAKMLPDWLLQPIKYVRDLVPDYYRYGKTFRIIYNELEFNESLSIEEKQLNELEKLKRIVNYSYKNVEYYRRIFDEIGLKPKDIECLEDIKKIPYLTKEKIIDNFNQLISKEYDVKDLVYLTTGGSSGTPLGFYEHKKNANATEWAFVTHIWKRVGYNVKKTNRFIILRGNNVLNGISKRNGAHLILSSYHLTKTNLEEYISLIEKFNPDFIQAYPSSIDILSKYLIEKGKRINAHNLKAILCSSEKLYEVQSNNAKKAFGVDILDLYGQTEHCCIAATCESGKVFHIQGEYGITELINSKDEYVNEEYERGEIVATSLNNFVMPFIRYKTGDIAINTKSICECGRTDRLIKGLEGRELEQIVTKSGAKVSLTALIFSQHFLAFSKIQSMQLEQKEIGKVIVKIVELQKLKNEDYEEIKEKMCSATGEQIDVDIEIVEKIERTNRGKHKFLLQHLKL